MLSSMLIWSLLPDGDEPDLKPGFGLPNTGCDGVVDAGELKGEAGPDETLGANPMDALLLVTALEVAPKENGVEEEEDVENPIDFGACQLEPKTVDAGLAMELTEMDSEEVVEEASPKEAPELNSLDVEEEPNVGLPEEKAALPVKAKGVDAGELNCIGMVCVAVPIPVPAAET